MNSPGLFQSPLLVREVLTSTPPVLTHVLPGLLAGHVGALVAPGGTGKTMLMLQVAFAVATAFPLCGGLFDEVPLAYRRLKKPGRVVFVGAEESAALLWHRMHAIVAMHMAQANLDENGRTSFLDLCDSNLHIHPLLGSQSLSLLTDLQEPTDSYHQLVEACAGARLVLIDPLRQFHAGDENNSWHMSSLVQLLQALAKRTGGAVIVAHHTNRASGIAGQGDSASASRGSTALTDGVRWQVNLSRPGGAGGAPGNPSSLRLDVAKANYLPPLPPQFLTRGNGGVLVLASSANTRKSRGMRPLRSTT